MKTIYKLLLIVFSFLVLSILIGISYALWSSSNIQENNNMVNTGCFDIEFSELGSNISLLNTYPMTDTSGLKTTPYSFSLKNTCSIAAKANIAINVLNTSSIDSKFIKSAIQVDNNIIETPAILNSLDIGEVSSTDSSTKDSFIIKTDYLGPGIIKNYNIWLWIDESADNSVQSKMFEGKIVSTESATYTVYDFDYTGDEQEFVVEKSGIYFIETWGAQGGEYNSVFYGGYGGYTSGFINLKSADILFINVGGQGINGISDSLQNGGYNGGGQGNYHGGSGGGATHISLTSGLLSTLINDLDSIIIVSGGGGGGAFTNNLNASAGGSGGGIIGGDALDNALKHTLNGNGYGTGGTQNAGGFTTGGCVGVCKGFFGSGANSYFTNSSYGSGGGGGGLYGGGISSIAGAGGGSGYIGNTKLISNETILKHMTCYNCQTSEEESMRTISTTNVSSEPISDYAKMGNGYARITYIG